MLMSILVLVIFLVVAFWIVRKMALPNPMNKIAMAVLGVLGLICLLSLIRIHIP